PALIAVANFTLGQHEKERRWAWMLWLVFLVGLGYAIYGAATASRGALVIGGALGLLCIGRALWWPRHLRHAEVAIAKAETYALARLGHDPL
ncbi:MAG: hypothetical protein QOD01_2234, partial [Actinomycetota bacterium]|nr:hypothetical protein [Actinomycetota bacterium]